MTEQEKTRHPRVEELHRHVEGRSSSGETVSVDGHLRSCVQCRSEVAEWRRLFSALEVLPTLLPSEDFSKEVMTRLASKGPVPWWTRVRQSLIGRVRGAASSVRDAHWGTGAILDYLDGRAGGRRGAAFQAHLEVCRACAGEVKEWKGLLARLEELPEVAPSPAFADRVIEAIDLEPHTGVAGVRATRLLGRIRSFLPEGRRGLAAATAMMTTPLALLGGAVYWISAHPVITPGALLSFVWWKGTTAVASIAGRLYSGAVESAVVREVSSLLTSLVESTTMMTTGGVALSLSFAAASWILYRNLIAPKAENGSHVRASA